MEKTFNLRKAQSISQELGSIFGNRFKPFKWNEIYEDTDEMISDLKDVVVPDNKSVMLVARAYNGYEYIHSFAKQVQSGKQLSDKQMVQCKRLALEIKKAKGVSKCWE